MTSERSATPIDFSNVTVSAKIDFVTIATPGKCALPPLDGTPIWSPKYHYRQVTIHDATARDVGILREVLDDPEILELEVAIDSAPKERASEAAHTAELNMLYDGIFQWLHPYGGALLSRAVKGSYDLPVFPSPGLALCVPVRVSVPGTPVLRRIADCRFRPGARRDRPSDRREPAGGQSHRPAGRHRQRHLPRRFQFALHQRVVPRRADLSRAGLRPRIAARGHPRWKNGL